MESQLLAERRILEQRLEEAHLHLADIKTSWCEKISSLETQVIFLYHSYILTRVDFNYVVNVNESLLCLIFIPDLKSWFRESDGVILKSYVSTVVFLAFGGSVVLNGE